MNVAIVQLLGQTAYSQARFYREDDGLQKKPKESEDDYERRTWRNRLHTTKDGRVYIPGSGFANCVKSAAKRLKLQVPGKGRVEYTKYFEAGLEVPQDLVLNIKAADVVSDKLFVPSNGQRGGGKRVMKYFPRVDKWGGEVMFWIWDDIITEPVFKQVLEAAGMLIGIGRFRPENCGFYGRFTVEDLVWKEGVDPMSVLGGEA